MKKHRPSEEILKHRCADWATEHLLLFLIVQVEKLMATIQEVRDDLTAIDAKADILIARGAPVATQQEIDDLKTQSAAVAAKVASIP